MPHVGRPDLIGKARRQAILKLDAHARGHLALHGVGVRPKRRSIPGRDGQGVACFHFRRRFHAQPPDQRFDDAHLFAVVCLCRRFQVRFDAGAQQLGRLQKVDAQVDIQHARALPRPAVDGLRQQSSEVGARRRIDRQHHIRRPAHRRHAFLLLRNRTQCRIVIDLHFLHALLVLAPAEDQIAPAPVEFMRHFRVMHQKCQVIPTFPK